MRTLRPAPILLAGTSSFLALTVGALALGPTASAWSPGPPPALPVGVDVVATTCTVPTILCPSTAPCVPVGGETVCAPATVCYTASVPKRGVGPSYPAVIVPRFNPALGTLRKVGVRVKVSPGTALFLAENIQTRPCVEADAEKRRYGGAITTFNVGLSGVGPILDLGSTGLGLLPASESLVDVACLRWGIQGAIDDNVREFDGCLNFALPVGTTVPTIANDGLQVGVTIATCAPPPIPAATVTADNPGALANCFQACAPNVNDGSIGTRRRAGNIVAALAPLPLMNESGAADYRIFNATDAYECTQCIEGALNLAPYIGTCVANDNLRFDISANSVIKFVGPLQCPGFQQRIEVTAGVDITVTYEYCPYPPLAEDDCADACRSVGSDTFINVLDNDRATNTNPPVGCPAPTLDCALLTGTTGIVQGLYGTATWVSGANCPADADSPCATPQRCIRYRLNTLPPTNCAYDQFTYTITNSGGCTDTATVRVLIANPEANDDGLFEICDDPNTAEILIPVLCNDTICPPDLEFGCPPRTLDCAFFTGSAGISGVAAYAQATWVTCKSCEKGESFLCSPNKCIRYRLIGSPPSGQRIDDFTYTIRDSRMCTDTATVRVRIASPIPVDDEATVCATIGQTIRINVLCNDDSKRPVRCDTLIGTNGLTDPTYGAVQWVSGNDCGVNDLCSSPYRCIEYRVDALPTVPPYSTVDTFTYILVDDLGCRRTGTVRVTLCRLDAVDDSGYACQGDPARVCILDNDRWGCGTLDCAAVTLLGVTPEGAGVATLTNSCTGGTTGCGAPLPNCTGCCLTFVPSGSFVGNATVRYRLRAGAPDLPGTVCESESLDCSDEAQVVICVAPRPLAADDSFTVTPGNNGPYVVNVLANDNPGVGCELCCSAQACAYDGCPVIVQQGAFTTSTVDPVTCNVLVTLLPSFIDSDTIRYRIKNQCGCCAEAIIQVGTCVTYNRNRPGSLVLYPEFDNRQSELTLLTLTNTNCNYFDGHVSVKVIYIDREDCSESDFVFTLTPCDTISWVTSFHNPNGSRGYVYVYAIDVQGRPISYNYLIGHQFRINGFNDVGYSVNPWVFRSSLPPRTLTDLDLDGIRDLDDAEYDRPPGEHLIPRFLGQDPAPVMGHQSDLVLVNLSGGTAFTTTVELDVFNDSEDPIGAQHTFYCWDRVALRDLSGAFDNTFLQMTLNDPDEIEGAPGRESGWFRLRGLRAISALEMIDRPSVLVHLIEIAGGLEVADLPYELCPAGNGDLLPTDPLGDGPIPSNSDNQ